MDKKQPTLSLRVVNSDKLESGKQASSLFHAQGAVSAVTVAIIGRFRTKAAISARHSLLSNGVMALSACGC